MKINIESTEKIVEVNGVPARIWQGRTARGVPVTALLTSIAVEREQDQQEFDADLQEHAAPTVAVEDYWPARMLIDHGSAREVEQSLTDLTFRAVSEINRARCERWHPGFPDDGWTGSDWSNAMAGEAGEACNVVKKLRRDDFGKAQAAAGNRADLVVKLATEIGDTFLYLDLLAQFYGLDIGRCIAGTFNRVSVREGFPERIIAGQMAEKKS